MAARRLRLRFLLPPRRSETAIPSRYVPTRLHSANIRVPMPLVKERELVGELFGLTKGAWLIKGDPGANALTVSDQDKMREELAKRYEHLPPGAKSVVERTELKKRIKEEIKTKIKARLRKEREDFYARQPKNEEERLMVRIKRAHTILGYKRMQLRKYIIEEPPQICQVEHDPEVLTAEQLHYLKKIGHKLKNYVPVGKRGVYGGTVENMHMHWKRHQTVRMDCHTFSMEETKEISEELAKLSGGIVVDILPDKTIIMYRGRNYEMPKKLIPPNTLNKRQALKKALIEQSIASRTRHIEVLERNLQQLREQREYEEKKRSQAIMLKDEAVKSVPKRKGHPLFKEARDAFDFDDDSDPCSETETDSEDNEAAGWSDEEDQNPLITEDEKRRRELRHIRQYLLRHRQRKKRQQEISSMKRRLDYERFGWTR